MFSPLWYRYPLRSMHCSVAQSKKGRFKLCNGQMFLTFGGLPSYVTDMEESRSGVGAKSCNGRSLMKPRIVNEMIRQGTPH